MSSSEEETSPVEARGFKAHMENKEKQLLITRQGFSSSESTSCVKTITTAFSSAAILKIKE